LTATLFSGVGWDCSLGASVVCTHDGPLPPPTTSEIRLTVNVNVPAGAPATVTNTATLTNNEDSNATNNSSSDTTSIVPPAGSPSLTGKKQQDGPLVQGQNGSVTLTITNGGSVATSAPIVVDDRFPAGFRPLSA